MKNGIILTFAAVFFSLYASSQGLLDKVDNLLDKADRTSNQADKAARIMGKGKQTLTGSKEKKTPEEKVKISVTEIFVTGADYEQIQKLKKGLENCQGVKAVKTSFNKEKSKVSVSHSTPTDDLLSEMMKESLIPKDAVGTVEEGSVSIAL